MWISESASTIINGGCAFAYPPYICPVGASMFMYRKNKDSEKTGARARNTPIRRDENPAR